MKIKFNRGPMKNKRVETQDYSMEYIIRQPIPMRVRIGEIGLPDITFREGSYHRSNVVLKDGTVVFEWMGWRE